VFEYLLPQALKLAFENLDEKFLRKDIHSGCTATVVIVNGRNVTTAAVGDSLATLDVPNRKGTSRLSNEHRLDCSDGERKRIVESGGEVRPTEFEDGPNGERRGVGPLRVWPGGLAVSRSIGDRDGKKGGVIATPDVSRVLLERGANSSSGGVMACRIVVASDGLWDAATPKMVSAETRKMNCQNAAAALVKLSQKAKFDNRDDVTVVVVDLDYHDDDEDVKAHPFVGCGPSNNSDEASPRPFWPLAAKGNRDPDEYDELPSERNEKIRKEILEKIAMEKQREIEMERERLARERIALEEKKRKEKEEAMMFEEVGPKNAKNKSKNKNTAENKKNKKTAATTLTREDVGVQKNAKTKKLNNKNIKNIKKKDSNNNDTTGVLPRAPMSIPPPLPTMSIPPPAQHQKKPNKNKKNAGGDDDGDDEKQRSDSPPKKKRNSKKNIVRKEPTMMQGGEPSSNNYNNNNNNNSVADPLHVIFQNAVSLPPSPAQDHNRHHHQQANAAYDHRIVAPTTNNALNVMQQIGMIQGPPQQQQQQQQHPQVFKRKGKKERQRSKAKLAAAELAGAGAAPQHTAA
jgi:serine/threonine protein phosphatase PrpC